MTARTVARYASEFADWSDSKAMRPVDVERHAGRLIFALCFGRCCI